MAHMYPERPKEYTANSLEGLMFDAFDKQLSDEYYVFHSFSIVTTVKDVLYESETDFVIFNPRKGLICLEAKAGNVHYSDGAWRYGDINETIMSHDGPYNQASRNKWKLSKYMNDHGLSYLLKSCKMMHAVWFPSVSIDNFKGVYLPPEADLRITLTAESFDNLEEKLDSIFALELPGVNPHTMTQRDENVMLERVLAPVLNLVSIPEIRKNHRRVVFKSMLKEQVNLLNYLEEQNTAVINGMAGTGKTIMAVYKAKKHADIGEKVLFLCYNQQLKNHLQQAYPSENIDFYTIDGFACRICDTKIADYDRLEAVLEEMYIDNSFPYKHVVIDEGQDFGQKDIRECKLVDLLRANVIDNENVNGTFYLFYDKNQMVQSFAIPEYIQESDCKLTLYKNCRNTKNIALTSLRLLGTDKAPKLYAGAINGDSPEMYFAQIPKETILFINKAIDSVVSEGYTNIQLLTCKTEEKSSISNECSDGMYFYRGLKIPFTTCRKYKGLEADVIILIDIDKDMFTEKGEQLMYVGSSRARYKLILVSSLTEDECDMLINEGSMKKTKNIYKMMATRLNAKYIKE